MASFSTVMDRLRLLRQADSFESLAIYIEEYPELLFSKQGMSVMMEKIPHIIRQKHETSFNYEFISQVINCHRCREIGGFKPSVTQNVADMPGGFANNDYALHILKLYVYNLVEVTKGECLSTENIYQNYPKNSSTFPECAYDYLGWLMLLPDYDKPSTDILWRALRNWYFKNSYAQPSFIRQIINIALPSATPYETSEILGYLWRTNESVDDYSAEPYSHDHDFVAQCRSQNIGWLDDQIRSDDTIIDGHPAPEFIIADCNEAFGVLSKIFNNHFVKENFFFEYLAEVSYYYPLVQQRMDTAARYERYFGDYAMMYMADMTSEIIQAFTDLSDYHTEAAVKVSENQIHRKAERIIMDIHRQFPDVPARIVELFFDDTCKAFGRGFNLAAPGAMLAISPMIYKIFERDEEIAEESDFSYMDMLAAMEMDDLTDTKFDDDDNNDRAENASLHRKADIKSRSNKAMKEGERKIYSAYHKYKAKEENVDNVLKNGISALKKAVTGDQHKMIIEGKEFSPIGFLKKVLATVAIFNYNKIAGILAVIVMHTVRRKANKSEKRKVLFELEAELAMVNEKIQDATSDGNRQAKYDLMRTKTALQNAIQRIKYGMGAEKRQGMADAKRLRSTEDYDEPNYRG